MENFNQKERMDNMGDGDAGSTKVTFGKHKGKTLKEIVSEDRSYVSWLADNAKQDDLKQAAQMVLNPKRSKSVDDAAKDVTEKMASNPKLVTENKRKLLVVLSQQIAKKTGVSEGDPANEVLAQVVKGWKGTDDDWKRLTDKDATTACNNLHGLKEALVGKTNSDPFQKKTNVSQKDIPLPFD